LEIPRQSCAGSELFESSKGSRPSNVRHQRADDGTILFSMLAVDEYHIANADATGVDELLVSVATQIRQGGSFRPCILNFVGYDDDPRAICEIPEIRRWCEKAWNKAPALVSLLDEKISGLSRMFIFCLVHVNVAQRRNTVSQFTVPPGEYAEIVRKAACSAADFLKSRGYSGNRELLD